MLRYGPLDEQRVCTLLKDVEAQVFKPIGHHTNSVGLAGLLFHRDQLLERYDGQTSSILPIPDVAVRLGVKQEVAYALVNLGLLETEISHLRSATGSRRQSESTATFHETYVFAVDLAKSLGRSPRAVIAALASDGIEPVASPTIGNCRQTLYRREGLKGICEARRWRKNHISSC